MKPYTKDVGVKGSAKGWFLAALALMAIGLALRIWKAWTGHLSPNSDFGIVCLAVKHMFEGKDLPVFFYGQPYMGNSESAIAAVLCRIFGMAASGFTTNLATALTGALLLPLVYVWAKDAGSRRAGVLALLFCVVGSDTNFHYAVAARGAYMATMVCGVLALWLSARIASSIARGETPGILPSALLGLAAGIGWYGTQLVVLFLAATGLILLTLFRRSVVLRVYLPAFAGFVVGSFPWWWWNINNAWGSLDVGTKVGRTPFLDGLSAFGRGFLRLVELWPLTNALNVARFALFIGILILFLVILVRDRRRHENSGTFHFRIAAPLLLLVGALISASSANILFQGADRYLLPLFPPVAVMLAVSCDWLLKKWRFPLGWIVMILLIPKHIYSLPKMPQDLVTDKPQWEAASQLAKTIGPFCDGVFIGGYAFHWMNFASDEKLCVATLPRERYAPYARRAELAEDPAFFADHCEIREFLLYTMGTSKRTSVAGIPVDYNLRPPSDDWRYLAPTDVAAAEDAEGKSLGEKLTDGVIDTDATFVVTTNSSTLTFTFNRLVSLCGIRFLSPTDQYPGRMVVAARNSDDGTWQEVLPSTKRTGYFWSGHHVMLEGLQAFQEVRFAAPTNGVTSVRLDFQPGRTPQFIRLGEILFLEKATAPEGAEPSVESCLAALRLKGVKQFYGPRWLSGHIALAAKDEISVLAPSSIFRTVNEMPTRNSPCPYPVTLRDTTGLMMDIRNAARSRSILSGVGLRWDEVPLGQYVLLVIQAPGLEDDAAQYPMFYWTEQGCFAADMERFAKRRAASLYEKATKRQRAGDQQGAAQMLQKALDLNPQHQQARRALIETLETLGLKEEAAANATVLKEETIPPIPASILFQGGIEFLGFGFSDKEPVQDGSVEISYFWKCPPSALRERPTMFVHFLKDEKICFQDDHDLLAGIRQRDLQEQQPETIFVEHRMVTPPPSTMRQEYKITVGLYHIKNGKRLLPKTNLEQNQREVTLPVGLKTG